LAEMERQGMEPSRALIRSISVYMRRAVHQVEYATKLLSELTSHGTVPTTAILNAVMSSCAERGDIDRTLSLIDEMFPRNNLRPNADSFSFAFEALGKHIGRRKEKPLTERKVEQILQTASRLLTMMEDAGIPPSHHVIRDYVSLLCHAGDIEAATNLALEMKKEVGLVRGKTIYCVAMANLELQNYDAARRLASCALEPMPFLVEQINKREKWDQHLANPNLIVHDETVDLPS